MGAGEAHGRGRAGSVCDGDEFESQRMMKSLPGRMAKREAELALAGAHCVKMPRGEMTLLVQGTVCCPVSSELQVQGRKA